MQTDKQQDHSSAGEKALSNVHILDAASERIQSNNEIPQELTADSVYDFYVNQLYPAIKASLPLLLHRVSADLKAVLAAASTKAMYFLLPNTQHAWSTPTLQDLLDQAMESSSNSTVAEFMLRYFDTNKDGHISPAELLNMTEILPRIRSHYPQTWFQWFYRSWPLMDWQVGVFLWQTCGGLLLLIAFATLLPGRLHGVLGKILRWPVLGLTYFLIGVELIVYIIIRLFIRIVEAIFASPKHRALRRKIRHAKSYDEWYALASELDISQGRDKWKRVINDDTSYRYNWSFIKSLIIDMRKARSKHDSLMVLAVLQQCTRKNVGGIMSEESFSFTNTGEPKLIVREFVEEVVATIRWVTEEALKNADDEGWHSPEDIREHDKRSYDERLRRKAMQEKQKVWASLVSWATLNLMDDKSERPMPQTSLREVKGIKPSSDETSSGSNTPTTGASLNGLIQLSELPAFHREKVRNFLKRAREAYGRTALCLSGGAMMGLYHFGIVKALLDKKCLPKIISGTSAGAVIAAIVCTRTDEELRRDLEPETLSKQMTCFALPWSERMKNLAKNGHMFNYSDWRELISWMTCGDMTFEEAYNKTGRIFCITLSATTKKAPPILLNYISAPNVVVATAVIASAAVPGFIPPVRLQIKENGVIRDQGSQDELYWDGSIEQDIPTSGLAEMLNCQFFIAAQCNPHIVPFFYNCKGGVGRPTRWSSGDREDAWRGGFLLSALELYLKSDMKAKFQFLNDIESAVGFTSTLFTQHYEGSTTIVPQVGFIDYTKLFSDPNLSDIHRCIQVGSIAAYEHKEMIELHQLLANELDRCIVLLED